MEGQDPVVQSLGFQSLAHLCEADVIGNLDYNVFPILNFLLFVLVMDELTRHFGLSLMVYVIRC